MPAQLQLEPLDEPRPTSAFSGDTPSVAESGQHSPALERARYTRSAALRDPRRNEPIREVYFPNAGVASVTAVLRDGAMVEIATIGDEGMVGINAFFGPTLMSGESMVQVPDTNAEAMPVDAFRTELDRRGAFYDCIQLYGQGIITLIS